MDNVGQYVVFSTDEDLGPSVTSRLPVGIHRISVRFPARLFRPDTYRLICTLAKKPDGRVDRKDDAIEFNIVDHDSWRSQQNLYRKQSLVAPELQWTSDLGLTEFHSQKKIA
jgi:hypothetical protein